MREQTIAVWQKQVRMRVLSEGSGPALVFFHGSWGLSWDPFLDELARTFTVYAPEHPGTTPDAPDDIYHLDNLWDLVLCYDELLQGLGLERPPSSATRSARWWRARWRPRIPPGPAAWRCSTRSASGAKRTRFPTGW